MTTAILTAEPRRALHQSALEGVDRVSIAFAGRLTMFGGLKAQSLLNAKIAVYVLASKVWRLDVGQNISACLLPFVFDEYSLLPEVTLFRQLSEWSSAQSRVIEGPGAMGP